MQILKEFWFSRLWAPWTIYINATTRARAPLYLSLTLHPLAPWPWWYRTARGPRGGWWRIHRIPSCLCLPSLQWTGKCTDLHARLSDITVCLSHHFVLFYVGTWIFKVYRWNISITDVGSFELRWCGSPISGCMQWETHTFVAYFWTRKYEISDH